MNSKNFVNGVGIFNDRTSLLLLEVKGKVLGWIVILENILVTNNTSCHIGGSITTPKISKFTLNV